VKDFEIASRLRKLKWGQSFQVKSEAERLKVLRAALTLRSCDLLKVQITTRRNRDPKTGKGLPGWIVIAL
jgi:hypothetical protein